LVEIGEVAKHNVDKRRHFGTGRDLYEAAERRGKKRRMSFSISGSESSQDSPEDVEDQVTSKHAPPKKKRRVTLH